MRRLIRRTLMQTRPITIDRKRQWQERGLAYAQLHAQALIAWCNGRPVESLQAAKPVLVQAAQPDLFDERAWRRASRRIQARNFLRRFPRNDTVYVAMLLGVTPRAVNYWRTAAHAPTPKHWRQLYALCAIVSR
jgi:hypothetical protein